MRLGIENHTPDSGNIQNQYPSFIVISLGNLSRRYASARASIVSERS